MPPKESLEQPSSPLLQKLQELAAPIAGQAAWEHLCERFKVPKQQNPNVSYAQHGRAMFAQRGPAALADGIIPNAGRTVAKHLYRQPIALGGKKTAEELLSADVQQEHPSLAANLGLATMPFSDAIFLTVFERLKTIQMTEQSTTRTSTLQLIKETPLRELYRGADALFFRQAKYWGITFGVEAATKHVLNKDKLSSGEQLASLLVSSAAVGAATMPYDVAKTMIQQKNSPYPNVASAFRHMGKVAQTEGVKALAKTGGAGFAARYVLNVGSTFVNLNIANGLIRKDNAQQR